MTGIDSYSTTASTNATATGGSVNWAEGQAAQSVNNSARQNMADERSAFNDLIWFQYGTGDQGSGNVAVPSVYASSTSFTIAGVDVTSVYHAGRRVRAVGSTTGTIYGSISSSSFSTNTTVNVTWASGSLSSETLVISLSQVPVTGQPVPATSIASGALSIAAATVTSLTNSGLTDLSGASAGQVKFPATQNASTNANTLDDYSENTFTPALNINGSATGVTYAASGQVGRYTKIGRMVYIYIHIILTSNGAGTGAATITGLPFTSVNTINHASFGIAVCGNISGLTPNTLAWIIPANSTSMSLFDLGGSTATDSNVTDSAIIRISGWYEAAA